MTDKAEGLGATAPRPPLLCECGEALLRVTATESTCVGYFSPPGHNHDDNCEKRVYECANGHARRLSARRRCPVCEWRGKSTCFCHDGEKLDEWPPDEPAAGPSEKAAETTNG